MLRNSTVKHGVCVRYRKRGPTRPGFPNNLKEHETPIRVRIAIPSPSLHGPVVRKDDPVLKSGQDMVTFSSFIQTSLP